MELLLNDNGAKANYRIEFEANNGQTLVTEGVADSARIDAPWSGGVSLRLDDATYTQRYEDKKVEEVAEETAKVEALVAPVRGSRLIESDTNPYMEQDKADTHHWFKTSSDGCEYAFEKSGDEFLLSVDDVDGDCASIMLTDEDRIKMAIRLLSIETDGVRVAGGEFDKNVLTVPGSGSENGNRSIGSAIFSLHSVLKQREYEKALKDWEESKRSEAPKDQEPAKTPEELHVERVLEEMCKKDPAWASDYRDAHKRGALKTRWKYNFAEHEANLLEVDALDAIALKSANDNRARGEAYTLEEAKSMFTLTFPEYVQEAHNKVEDIGVTAVQYAKVMGIEFPAK